MMGIVDQVLFATHCVCRCAFQPIHFMNHVLVKVKAKLIKIPLNISFCLLTFKSFNNTLKLSKSLKNNFKL